MKAKFKLYLFSGVLCSLLSQNTLAALELDSTRYVYAGDNTVLSVTVKNTEDQDYGGQVWVENIAEQDTRPAFIATPSFFKIKKHDGRQVFRLIKASDQMLQDKESIYWLNLQEIPPKINGNGISLALRTRVKLIYRPMALVAGRAHAEENMSIEHFSGKQFLVNSTPYIFAISSIYDVNNKQVKLSAAEQDKLTMFMPGDKVDVTGFVVKSVMALDDFGNIKSYVLHGHGDNKTGANDANITA